jgi:RNA polymerase sigma factor (sigma-70 family)
MSGDQQEFQALLEGLRAGSEDAARKLVAGYGKHVLRVVRYRLHRRLRSQFDSGDFTQAVWASFFASPLPESGLEQPEDLIKYLVTVASNKVVDAVRQRLHGRKYNLNCEHSLDGSAAAEVQRLADDTPSPSRVVMAKEHWDGLRARGDQSARRMLEMLSEGKTYQQVAAQLGVSEKTVQRFLRRLDREARR